MEREREAHYNLLVELAIPEFWRTVEFEMHNSFWKLHLSRISMKHHSRKGVISYTWNQRGRKDEDKLEEKEENGGFI